jgi:RNA polymerase sigma factor (sigma-70 family)
VADRPDDFSRVYEENVWRVYAVIAYRAGDSQLAEDLTQTTFERALRAWGRFDPRRGSEQAWLLTIARNLLIDHSRRAHPATVEMEEQHESSAPGPDAHVEASSELTEALQRLSDRDREVLALRFAGDLATSEIAAMLDESVGNVQQILSRSLRKLRGWLDERPERAEAYNEPDA